MQNFLFYLSSICRSYQNINNPLYLSAKILTLIKKTVTICKNEEDSTESEDVGDNGYEDKEPDEYF